MNMFGGLTSVSHTATPVTPGARTLDSVPEDPARRLLREFVDLCAIGDITEDTDDGIGWAKTIREANHLLGLSAESSSDIFDLTKPGAYYISGPYVTRDDGALSVCELATGRLVVLFKPGARPSIV